jgi:hypothetical protein
MIYFQVRYIHKVFLAYSPFSNKFSANEIQEIVNESIEHIKRLPFAIYQVFNFGSLIFTLIPILDRIPFFSRIEKLLSKFVNTILLLYISERVSN